MRGENQMCLSPIQKGSQKFKVQFVHPTEGDSKLKVVDEK